MRKENMLDALFPRVRQQILGALLLRPERRWYLSDLAHHLAVEPSARTGLADGGRHPDA